VAEIRSWRDSATTRAVVAFVEGAARAVPPEERIAVVDNRTLLGVGDDSATVFAPPG